MKFGRFLGACRRTGALIALHACGLAIAILLLAPRNVLANPIVINFEGLSDSTILTNQYPGLSFSNAIILTAGISLNEFEFPPFSGSNVASDNGGPMRIDFTQPVADVGGFFTYAESLTLRAFD